MKLASVLTPPSSENMQLAVQCGVEGIVTRYPGPTLSDLVTVKQRIEDHGLQLFAIEGYLPIEKIKLGIDEDGSEMRAMKELIRNLGTVGVPLLCYNFMAGTDWVRTELSAPERGGAKVTGFNLQQAEQAVSLNASESELSQEEISAEQLWANLEAFLKEVIPVAEEAQVTLVMHPDDPPLPVFHRKARIMNSIEAFEKLVALVPSPRNAICFCQGTFAAMGVDIPSTIRRLGRHIQYVHFRDAQGSPEAFVETFHDNGPTDMAAAIRAYEEIGFNGPIRPDHVPQLYGEDDGEPGYTMLGRLFAYGYIRGLIDGTKDRRSPKVSS